MLRLNTSWQYWRGKLRSHPLPLGGHEGIAAYLRQSGICAAVSPNIIEKACRAGRLDLVQEYDRFLQASSQVAQVALNASICLGHLDIIQWIRSRFWERVTEPVSLCEAAAFGRLNVLQWFHDNGEGDWTRDLMECAAEHGQSKILQWLQLYRSEGCTSSAMDSAACNGYLETVMWLHTNRSEGCTAKAMDDAARGGHLEMVKWLHMNRSECCTTQAMDLAAKNGHLEILQWLHVHRTDAFTAQAIEGAVSYGHLGVTQWLCSKRPGLLTTGPLQAAIFYGNFAITAYLYPHFDRGLGSDIVLKAAVCGHVPMLQWLCERFPGQVDYRQIRTIATRYRKCPRVEERLASIA
ncbi:hypothetical protein Poli38472_003817 [Pythium oligandrum]|uniref:Ankyrin repeat-containing domain n=1 Tax=Pythium oligandrum TaxID=41045 RepID=A0A8K1CM45_PYTOL|nr:hypothetical protein Poli38472_003817 [Pythium oligandrum]|eukprot:TMW66052.1 hypothetical protein Poli38472_003817 [Pythium oligandrum]